MGSARGAHTPTKSKRHIAAITAFFARMEAETMLASHMGNRVGLGASSGLV